VAQRRGATRTPENAFLQTKNIHFSPYWGLIVDNHLFHFERIRISVLVRSREIGTFDTRWCVAESVGDLKSLDLGRLMAQKAILYVGQKVHFPALLLVPYCHSEAY